MNTTEAHAAMIACERGLGRMLPKACARFWRVANRDEPGTIQHCCEGCPDGQKRSGLVKLSKRKRADTGRTNGMADRECRACEGMFAPTSRTNTFCHRPKCLMTRQVAANKRAEKRRKNREAAQ